MRIGLTVFILALLGSSLQAQDRLMTLSLFNTPTLVETEVSGLTLGPVRATTLLPPHYLGVSRPDLRSCRLTIHRLEGADWNPRN